MNLKIFEKIIYYASKAPSADNLQPWRIKKLNSKNFSFELYYEEQKDNPFIDFQGNTSKFSCGCFLKNLEISANEFGYKTLIKINENEDQNLIAKIEFEKLIKTTENELFKCIEKRNTNRYFYDKKIKLTQTLIKKIEDLCSKNKIKTYNLEGEQRKNITELIYEIETIKLGEPKILNEVMNSVSLTKNPRIGLDYRSINLGLLAKPSVISGRSTIITKISSFSKINYLFANKSAKKPIESSGNLILFTINKKDFNKKKIIELGMLFEELWLVLTKEKYDIQPFANLTFMLQSYLINKSIYPQKYHKKINNVILNLENELNLSINETIPIFLFRCGKTNKKMVETKRLELEEIIIN